MDYSNIIEVDNLTVLDCVWMYGIEKIYTSIQNGNIVSLKKETCND